jgi:hypothetical protein
VLTGALDYLARCERAASLRNRRDLIQHYQECWRFLWDINCGALPLPILAQFPKVECPPSAPGPMKGWKRDLLSRPMRKVVKTRDEFVPSSLGADGYWITLIQLSCSHIIEELKLLTGERPMFRRRCRECANPARATYAQLQRKGVKPV